MPYATDWRARADDLAEQLARDASGKALISTIMPGADEYVGITFASDADLTDVDTSLWKLATPTESADVDVSADDGKLPADWEQVGQRIQQRVANLDGGRVYLWQVMHGEPGNRSADVLMIKCPALGGA